MDENLGKESIDKWIRDNFDIKSTGWDPYPTSLRVVNWLKWQLRGNVLSPDAIKSLHDQVVWLEGHLEYHLLANHLFANAKALVFAGLCLKCSHAEAWLSTGLKILKKELAVQLLEDGGHFERSPMYHNIFVEDLADLKYLGHLFSQPGLEALSSAVTSASQFSRALRHPDGDIPHFNDAAANIAPTYDQLENYLALVGAAAAGTGDNESRLFDHTGFARLEGKSAVLLADVGGVGPSFQPGHAHAETLSYELSIDGRRFVVNTGVSLYEVSRRREYERGSQAHNCLVLDGENSSEVWSSFRVGRRARTSQVGMRQQGGGAWYLQASHDGYRWLRGRPMHKRMWQLGEKTLTVSDQVTGKGIRRAENIIHFAPSIGASEGEPGTINLTLGKELFARLRFSPGLKFRLESYKYVPRFGETCSAKRVILFNDEQKLPFLMQYEIAWN